MITDKQAKQSTLTTHLQRFPDMTTLSFQNSPDAPMFSMPMEQARIGRMEQINTLFPRHNIWWELSDGRFIKRLANEIRVTVPVGQSQADYAIDMLQFIQYGRYVARGIDVPSASRGNCLIKALEAFQLLLVDEFYGRLDGWETNPKNEED